MLNAPWIDHCLLAVRSCARLDCCSAVKLVAPGGDERFTQPDSARVNSKLMTAAVWFFMDNIIGWVSICIGCYCHGQTVNLTIEKPSSHVNLIQRNRPLTRSLFVL